MPDKFNELLLRPDIIELYNDGITPDYGYLMNGRFEKDMIKTLCPLKTLIGNPISWETSDTEYLFPIVSLEPKQAGSGDPSPDNVRPISGYDSVNVTISKDKAQVKQIALTLPETIYGGTVDAVTGVGSSDWTSVIFDGTENWKLYNFSEASNRIMTDVSIPVIEGYTEATMSNVLMLNLTGQNRDGWVTYYLQQPNVTTTRVVIWADGHSLDELKQIMATAASQGTPLQIAYKVANPSFFQATGNQALTIQPGNHTIYTDGNNISLSRKARRLEV